MKKLKKGALALFLIFSCLKGIAQNNNTDNLINKFFEIYETQNTDKAFDYIFSTNKLIPEKDVNLIKTRILKYSNVLGKYHGKETFIEQKINNAIQVRSYILKYETQPLRFIFTFYKPNDIWKIQNFKISDDFIEEIENASIKLKYK